MTEKTPLALRDQPPPPLQPKRGGIGMKGLFTCVFALAAPCFAVADGFNKTVRSGETTRMRNYASLDSRECTSKQGVVKVLAKPQHGKLTTRIVEGTIGRGRAGTNPLCRGTPVPKFEVSYTSDRSFRGTDRFDLEITSWRGRRRIDTYTIRVE